MGKWYYSIDGKTHGPVDDASLKRMAESLAIKPHYLVNKEGSDKWTEAVKIKGLFSEDALVKFAESKMAQEALPRQEEKPSPKFRIGMVLGMILFLLSSIAALRYFAMDTSVEVPSHEVLGQTIGGGRVHNVGLVQDRQNGLLVSISVAALGVVLMVVNRQK